MYNLTKYRDNYSKTFGSLWQCYRDEPALTDTDTIEILPGNSDLFKSKVKITGKNPADCNKKDAKIAAPLK